MKLENLELDIADSHALINVLRFYASPATYYHVAMIPGEHCGSIIDDFHDTRLGKRPGKKASAMLYYLYDLVAGDVPKTDMPLIENLINKEKEMGKSLEAVEVAIKAEIPEQTDDLLRAVETLESISETLELNILDVLSNSPETKSDSEAEPVCSSSVARDIQTLRQRISQVNRRLDEVNDRVEL